MTKEELYKKVDDIQDEIDSYTQKLCNEIEDLKDAYIAEHCQVKKNETYVRNSDGKKFIVVGITISDDFIINFEDDCHNLIYCDYLSKFLTRYTKEEK